MGYFFGWNNLEGLVHDLTKDEGILNYWLIRKDTDTAHLWVAARVGERSGIVLYLLERYKNDWGYKPIDESMGPAYYDCPLEALEITKGLNEGYSEEWRNKVRQYHSA